MTRALRAAIVLGALAASVIASSGCKKKVDSKQCDELLDRFSELVVKERFPDASADVVAAERAREKSEAKATDELKNCTSEVQREEYACAMKAASSDAFIKCLE